MMKKLILAFAAALLFPLFSMAAEQVDYRYTEATQLTIVGKLYPDTPNPYYRLDLDRFTGFTEKEIERIKMSSGMAVSFVTNATSISVQVEIASSSRMSAMSYVAQRGFDLYIKKDGVWTFAGVKGDQKGGKDTIAKHILVKNMDDSEKECLMYFPLYSELTSVKVGVPEGSTLKAGKQPFRHKIAIFGSSFTHGCGASRPGMTYPAQFTRATGLQLLSMGVSGCSKLQPSFARALAEADAEAYVFDGFSNGSGDSIRKNLFNFIETIQAAKPGVPLIFMSGIYWQNTNFDAKARDVWKKKADAASEMMAQALEKYKDVYFIPADAANEYNDVTADGVHPSDLGYYLWMKSVKDPIVKILSEYGIK